MRELRAFAAEVKALREDADRRAAEEIRREKELESMRRRSLVQHADILADQARFRRVAADIYDRLRRAREWED